MDRQLVDPPAGSGEPERLAAVGDLPDFGVSAVLARVDAVADDERPAIRGEGDAHGPSAGGARGLRPVPEHLASRGVPHGDLVVGAGGDFRAIGADRQPGDHPDGHPLERPAPRAGRHVPDADATARYGGRIIVKGLTRPAHDPLSIGTEGNGLHARPPALQGQPVEVGEPLDVVPLPAAAPLRQPWSRSWASRMLSSWTSR